MMPIVVGDGVETKQEEEKEEEMPIEARIAND